MKKERVLIRFRPEIYECFELEAAYQGLRVTTLRFRRASEAAIMCCQKAKIL